MGLKMRGTKERMKLLRLLRISRGLHEASNEQEKIAYNREDLDQYYNYQNHWKEMKADSLEVEGRKAQALMKWQEQRLIC